MDAVNEVVWGLFPSAYIRRAPSHEVLSKRTYKFIREADWCFVGGTNLLSSDIRRNGLWQLGKLDAKIYQSTRTVCLGVGWNSYMVAPTPATRQILRDALSPSLIHSARDSYTSTHLDHVGLQSIATACPTMWALTPEHCANIPRERSSAVVFTLTAWQPNPQADRNFVNALRRHYAKVYFFPQMQDDWAYFRGFGWEDIKVVSPTVESYTRFLDNENVDVVGTRLHGGIRALQRGRRALILAIDNRATEIHKDTGLPTIQRTDIKKIEEWIEAQAATVINLPQDAIQAWKAQFQPESRDLTPRQQRAPGSFLERTIRALLSIRRGARYFDSTVRDGLGMRY